MINGKKRSGSEAIYRLIADNFFIYMARNRRENAELQG
jgi:hypothetical protein